MALRARPKGIIPGKHFESQVVISSDKIRQIVMLMAMAKNFPTATLDSNFVKEHVAAS